MEVSQLLTFLVLVTSSAFAGYYLTWNFRTLCDDLSKRFSWLSWLAKLAKKKPFSCDICMAGWASFCFSLPFGFLLLQNFALIPLLAFAAAGLALRIMRR